MNFQRVEKWERSKEERDFLFAFRDEGNVRRRRRGIPWNSALSERERERKGNMEIERIQRREGRSVSGQSEEKEKTLTTTITTPSSPANNNN